MPIADNLANCLEILGASNTWGPKGFSGSVMG